MKVTKRKQLKVDDELLSICKAIHAEEKTDAEWAQIESCDMFQSPKYSGGYEAIEQSFWFSYYDPEKIEWWFEITLVSIQNILKGELLYLDLHEPKK